MTIKKFFLIANFTKIGLIIGFSLKYLTKALWSYASLNFCFLQYDLHMFLLCNENGCYSTEHT